MKFIAKPVIVDAYIITNVEPIEFGLNIYFDNKKEPKYIDPKITARYCPVVGDYWVIQSDGYGYLNPKEVFERKYSPLAELNDEKE